MSEREFAQNEKFLRHARSAAHLSETAEKTISELTLEALREYLDNWNDWFFAERERRTEILSSLNATLAKVLCHLYDVDADDDWALFHGEEGALKWLTRDGHMAEGELDDYVGHSKHWMVRGLWNIRLGIEAEIHDLDNWERAYSKNQLLPGSPQTRSRLPGNLQDLIYQLCRIWYDQVDKQLGLPRRSPNPDNPLLRFIDVCLAIVHGDRRPPKKTVLQLVQRFLRPAIFEEARARAEEETAEAEQGWT